MKKRVLSNGSGGLELTELIAERTDPVSCLPFEKLTAELEYMGIKTIGDFTDDFDAIMGRIQYRFPDFFENENFTRDDIVEFIKFVE